eukprot:gene8051-10832_t
MEELIMGPDEAKNTDDSTYLERFRAANGMSKGAPVPKSAPTADTDHRLPPEVDAVTMLDARDEHGRRVYPIDDDDAKLSRAMREGFEAYLRYQDVIFLVQTQRFKDADGPLRDGIRELKTVNPHGPHPTLLRTMRDGPLMHGEEIPDELFEKVLGTARQTPAALDVPGSFPAHATHHIAHQWEFLQGINRDVVSLLAEERGEMLFYVAANDTTVSGPALSRDELQCVRHAANPGNVGNRLGVLSLYEGMRVELSEKISSAASVLKATQGIIERIIFDANEDTSWTAADSPERLRGWVALKHVPRVLVRIDGFTDGPIPARPDLLLVSPSKSRSFSWEWKTAKVSSNAVRFQLALWPTHGLTPFTAQGMTTMWVILHLWKHDRRFQDWWYQAYVAISRAQNEERLAVYSPIPPFMKRLLGIGPAPHLVAENSRLRQLALRTRPKLRASARQMGCHDARIRLDTWH